MTTPQARYVRWRSTAVIVWAIIGILVLLGAALMAFGRISSAFIPFVIAFVVVFLLNSPVKWLEARGMKRGLAAALSLVGAIVVVALLITVLVPVVSRQAVSFAAGVQTYVQSLDGLTATLQQRYTAMRFPDWLASFTASGSTQLSQVAVRVGNGIAGSLVSAGGGLANGVFDVLLALVIAFWMLRDLPKIREEIGLLAGPRYTADVEHLMSTVTRVGGGYLKGQTIASVCTGAIATVGLAFIVPKYAVLLGIVTLVFNFVPYIGPFVAGALAAFVTLITVGPLPALIAIALIVAAQNVTDTLITPRIMSEQVDLHPTLVIFSLLVGGTLFGITGMIFAIPVAAILKGLFVYYYERHSERQITTEDGALFKTPACDPDDESDTPCVPDEDDSPKE